MATFKYSAFDSNEKSTTGFINATDLEEAKQMLQDRGLTPLKINTKKNKICNQQWRELIFFIRIRLLFLKCYYF